MNDRVSVPVGIDIPSFISVMRRTFNSDHVHIRELTQNALEATFQATRHGFAGNPINTTADEERYLLSVTDEGIGMTRDELQRNLSQVFLSGWPKEPGGTLGIGQF